MEMASGHQSQCRQHGRLIEYFCEDDQVPICSRCYIMGEHKDHAILSMEEKNKSVVTSLENGIEMATIVLNKLSKLNKKPLELGLRSEKSALIEVVAQHFHKLHSVLKQREKEIIDDVCEAYSKIIFSAHEQIQNAKNEKPSLEKALHESRMLLENQALLVDGDSLLKMIHSARYIHCILPNPLSTTMHLKFDATHINDIAEGIQSFGSIKGDRALNIHLKTVNEAPEEVLEEDKVLKTLLYNTHRSCDTYSISSADTGEDVIIESDSESVNSAVTTKSSASGRSGKSNEVILPSVKGTCKQITITHIRSPGDFYVQLLLNKNRLEALSRNMNAWCRKKSSKLIPKNVKNGMIVLACYSADNQWYRARVIDVEAPHGNGDQETKIHVLYFDFGNEEKVPMKNLRVMQPRFEFIAPFAVHCSLYDIAPYDNSSDWDNASTQEFFRITQNQILLLNVIAMNGPIYEVDLVSMPTEDVLDDRYSSVRDMLIFLEHGRFAHPSQQDIPGVQRTSVRTVNYFKPTKINTGESVEMIISEATSPSNIYIMPSGDENAYYAEMMEEMQEIYNNDSSGLYMVHCPRKDMVCVVKAPDEQWYRGKIMLEPKRHNVTVFLPDIGSTLVVHYDKIKKLLSQFIKLPSQAVCCTLADIGITDPALEDWSHDAKIWCQTDFKGHQGTVRIVRWGEVTEVVLWIDAAARSINSLLVEAGLAVSTGLSSLPEVQKNDSSDLNRVTKLLYVGKESCKIQPSLSSETKKSTNCVNTDESKSLKSNTISSSLSSSTTLSLHESKSASNKAPLLPNPKSNSTAKSTSPAKGKKDKTKKVKQLKSPKKTSVTNTSQSDERDSYDSSQEMAEFVRRKVQEDIHRALEGNDGDSEVNDPQESTYVEIILSFYKSPSYFFIRVKEQENDLKELMEELNLELKDSVVDSQHTWNCQDFCAVKNPEDGKWYRGVIQSKISASELEVELLDIGNRCNVSEDDLRLLVRDFGPRLHRAAVRCQLAKLIPTGSNDRTKWSQTAIEYVSNATYNKKLYIKTEGEPTDTGLPIDIIIEEEIPETAFDPVTHTYHSLRQMIQDQGLAIVEKPRKLKNSLLREEKSNTSLNEVESHKEQTEIPKIPRVVEVPPYDIPENNQQMNVIPTYIDFDGVIYAQNVDWDEKITHVSTELQRVYQNSQTQSLSWSPGNVCVAYFDDDGLWYRGLIEIITGDKAKIFYMDFGNSAWVNLDKLREMEGLFAEYHVQVYHCVLKDLIPNTQDGKWPVAILDTVHEMVVNSQCVMTFTGLKENGHLKIKLQTSDGQDLSSFLIKQDYGLSTMDLKEQFSRSRAIGAALSGCALCTPSNVGLSGNLFAGIATEVELPNIVYIQRSRVAESEVHDFVKASEIAQINNEMDEFVHMMADLKKTSSSGFIKLPDVGLLCLAKFHYDDEWYRALCVEKHPQHNACLVVFIDYGTSELVSKDRLRMLPTEFWDLPIQGIRCHLNLLPPGGPDAVWQKNSMDAMIECLCQKSLKVKVVQSKPLTVELLVETEGGFSLVYEELVQKGLAVLPMEINMDMLMGHKRVKQGSGDVEIEEEEYCVKEVETNRNCNTNSINFSNSVEDNSPSRTSSSVDNLHSNKGEKIAVSDNDVDDDDEWITDSDDE